MLTVIGIFIFLWLLTGFITILFVIKYIPENAPTQCGDDTAKVLLICTVLWPLVVLMYSSIYTHEYIIKHNLNFSINLNDLIYKFYVYCSRKLFGEPKE